MLWSPWQSPPSDPIFQSSFIQHSFIKYFVTEAVLDAEETAGVKVDRNLSFMELKFEKASKTQTNKYIIYFN